MSLLPCSDPEELVAVPRLPRSGLVSSDSFGSSVAKAAVTGRLACDVDSAPEGLRREGLAGV